jgi:hypothetical protein
MNYKDIQTFNQRCDTHPDHQDRIIGHQDIQLRLHEEVAELRHYIEWYLTPSPRADFTQVRTITNDGRCLGWDGNEVNMAP